LDETSRATGSRQGGVRGYYVSEASEINASTPKFRRIELNLNKLCVLVYSTEELLSDAGLLENVVKNAAIHEISFQIDDAILNGLGVGMPLGVLQASSLVPQSAETGQASGTIDLLNCTKLWSRLLPGSREHAVWVISPGVEQALYHMSLAVGTGGSAVFLPGGGASDAPYSTLMGRPLIVHESAQAIGTQGDILLADFKNGYILAEKVGGIKSSISIHVRFIYDEQIFKFTYRYDGCPVLAASGGITPFKGSDKLGHFVALADR
jgi:HK97 family phage major capsid protein